MRLFDLVRSMDVTGASGTGVVARGVIFDDGTVAMRWATVTRSTALYDCIEDVETIHGHEGATVVRYVPTFPGVPDDMACPWCGGYVRGHQWIGAQDCSIISTVEFSVSAG